jgi:RNA recognition motif-containing protein
MNSKLYVGNLSFDTTEDAIRAAFAPFGTVTDVHLPTARETGRARGFAFEKMSGAELDGRKLTVNEARPKEDSGGRSFGPDRRAGAFQARNKRR